MTDKWATLSLKGLRLESAIAGFIECGVTIDRMALIESYTLTAVALNSLLLIDGVPRYTFAANAILPPDRRYKETWHVF